jgi:ribosomal protein S18 acetylase RimI-like enzyme
MTDTSAEAAVVQMMAALYHEDPPQKPVDPESFGRTIRRFLDQTHTGRIVLFWLLDEIVGYAIVVPYWSNELGGSLAFLDELYVVPQARKRGIATAFLNSLREQRPFDALVALLEVSPDNVRAKRLYAAMGFRKRKNETMVLPLNDVIQRPSTSPSD